MARRNILLWAPTI